MLSIIIFCKLAVLLTVSELARSIATRRLNVIEDRPFTAIGATVTGSICDDGFTIAPSQKEFTVSWDLGDIYILHEIKLTFKNKDDAQLFDEITARIGFSDSNFYTHYKTFATKENVITLRPDCFANNQWGASGSTLKLHFRGHKKVTIDCIEAFGLLMDGKNVMIGKPVGIPVNKKCEWNLHLLNDIFEDGSLNYEEDPFNIRIDLGKEFKPKEMIVSVARSFSESPFDEMDISFRDRYGRGHLVDSCVAVAKHKGKYVCPIKGMTVRYVDIEGEEKLPPIREITINV